MQKTKTFFARLVGVCPAFDGLVVEVVDDDTESVPGEPMLYTVLRVSGMPVAPGSVLFNFENLEMMDAPPSSEELATDNPYGKFLEDERWCVGSDMNELIASRYEKAAVFHIRNQRRSLADLVLWGRNAEMGWEALLDFQRNPAMEPLDLLIVLKALEEG